MGFDMQPPAFVNGELYVPSAREAGDGSSWNLFHKFLKNASFHLTARNPSVVQLEVGQDLLFQDICTSSRDLKIR